MMPTFLFLCPDGHGHERQYGFSDEKPKSIACQCGKKAKRQIGTPFPIFKGSGFYQSRVEE